MATVITRLPTKNKRDSVKALKFTLLEKERQRLEWWLEDHYSRCPFYNKDECRSGTLTFCFTPTGVGDAIEVRCQCGSKVNITDYESW